jgi:uncharacterized protein (DUF1778 family)
MPTLAATASKRETLNIRIRPEERGLIDRAAQARGKNRTDFILDAARLAAEETLLDQVLISTSPAAYADFLFGSTRHQPRMSVCAGRCRLLRRGTLRNDDLGA